MARKASGAERAAKICERIAEEMQYELCDVAFEKEHTGLYMRIYIDKEGGITLDDCEKFHRAAQPKLDDIDYDFMEVSSPGIDRPLKKDRDFERNLGSPIEIHLYRPLNGAKVLTGVLAGLEDGEILLEGPEGVTRIPRKSASLVKPVVDMDGIEEVDLGEEPETDEETINEATEEKGNKQ